MGIEEDWAAYYANYEKNFRPSMEKQTVGVHVPIVHSIALKVTFLVERKYVTFAKDEAGTVVKHLVSKFTNELFAFIGAMNAGSMIGAYHHSRALIELRAATHYLFANSAETNTRIKRFTEWEHIVPYLTRTKLQLKLNDGKIDQATFDAKNLVSPALIAHATPERIAEWVALYGKDVKKAKVREWHSPDKIEDLLTQLDPTGKESNWYGIVCNATHISPIGPRLASFAGPSLIGWDPMLAAGVVLSTAQDALKFVVQINPRTGGVIWPALGQEWQALQDANKKAAPSAPSTPTSY